MACINKEREGGMTLDLHTASYLSLHTDTYNTLTDQDCYETFTPKYTES